MPIGVKAAFNYSATAATTSAWTLTASTSVAVGGVLVFSAAYRGSASHSISAIGDNAGNSWARAIEQSSLGFTSAIWYAPVSTTTAGFKVTVGLVNGRTVSARATHILVLTGVDLPAPLDPATTGQMALVSSAATTATLSTSAATAVPNEILVVAATQNNIGSATINAASGWVAHGSVIAVQGGVSLKKYLWTYSASAAGIYAFSASLSNGGAARTRQFQIAGFRPAAEGAVSATAAFDFGSASSLSARGELQAERGANLTATGSLGGIAKAGGQAEFILDVSGLPDMAGDLRGSAALTFAAVGDGTSGQVPAAPSSTATGTLLGGGWDRRLFRRVLEQHLRRWRLNGYGTESGSIHDAARQPLSDAVGSPLAAIVTAFDAAWLRREAHLAAQAQSLAGVEQALATVGESIEREWQEREAEAVLLLAA